MLTMNKRLKQLGFNIKVKDNQITISKFSDYRYGISIVLELKSIVWTEKYTYSHVTFYKSDSYCPVMFSYACYSENKKDLLEYLNRTVFTNKTI